MTLRQVRPAPPLTQRVIVEIDAGKLTVVTEPAISDTVDLMTAINLLHRAEDELLGTMTQQLDRIMVEIMRLRDKAGEGVTG